jgi:aryl-alcohol dehydrogenase-like predicted oxidoreductase
MRYRKFGRTGIEISDIAPRLWGMGGWSGSDDNQSLEALQLSVDLGCNFFETAWAYGEGKSDGLLGQTIARNMEAAWKLSVVRASGFVLGRI